MYKKVDTNLDFVSREEEISKFWADNDIFRKSIREREGDPTYMFYDGHADTYIVYSQSDTMNSYSGDDNILGVVPVYDFDIYSKTNYGAIESGLRSLLTSNNWTWQPNRDSPDLYDKDTGFYHKTCAYAKPLQI